MNEQSERIDSGGLLAELAMVHGMEAARSVGDVLNEDADEAAVIIAACMSPEFCAEKVRVRASERELDASANGRW